MNFRKPTPGAFFLPIAILLTITIVAAFPIIAGKTIQAHQVQAAAADEVGIVGKNLQIAGQVLDLEAKPALFIDASCRELLDTAILLPAGKIPYIIVCAENEPDFMPAEFAYYWSKDMVDRAPLLVWYDQQLIGYMGQAVEPHLNEMLYPRLIGEGKIVNVINNGTAQNGATAAGQITGAVVEPGETFSFYDYVLPAKENGYVYGLTLFGQQWLPDIGGGVCRTSTALNFAVEDAQLEVIERHRHTGPVSYASRGEDTAVTRGGRWDYRFRNTTDESIQIYGEQNGNYLEFKIYALRGEKNLAPMACASFSQKFNLPADALSLRVMGGLPVRI
ncbi:MAG: VanW family protein [Syntrophomonadaceae bacterium]